MFDRIVFISDQSANIKLKDSENITIDLMNLHLVFEDDSKKVLGEVSDINGDIAKVHLLGEIVGDKFLGGTIRKPKLDAKIRIINDDEMLLITGKDERGFMEIGVTPYYDNAPVYLNINSFFSGHFAIFGNSGSGKSCGISRLFQNMFHNKTLNPYNANILLFDSSGEYYNAFGNLNSINPNYHYRFISTNEKNPTADKLRVPIYLLNKDDLALLLQATNHSQLPIVERMKKLALVFSQKDMDANNYKNHLIAKAIMTILYTNETAPNKRNEIFSVLASCSTPQFNLEAVLQGIGYTRKFRECFLIDNSGNFSESVLLTEYVSSFINEEYENYEPKDNVFYNLDTLEKALNFTLISEGWLRNKNTYGDAVTLKVRLHSLIASENAKYFDVKEYMSLDKYLMSLLSTDKKFQIVNINLDGVDDDFAKVITKVFSRLIFDYSKGLVQRNTMPFHIVVEEAHRYIQNDTDRFLIGYNIFERIAKEGRKYGAILGLISQRPVELSDTVISQCSNFLIFKMNHPVDVDYIRKMVPNINDEIVEKQKNLQSGTCLGFGAAFRIPMIIKMKMPDPAPWSDNCDVVTYWSGGIVGSDNSVGSVPSNIVINPADQNSNPIIANNQLFSSTDIFTTEEAAPSELVKTVESGGIFADHIDSAISQEADSLNDDTVVKLDETNSNTISSGSGGFISTLSNDDNNKSATTDTGVPLVSLLDSDIGSDDLLAMEKQSVGDTVNNNFNTGFLSSPIDTASATIISNIPQLSNVSDDSADDDDDDDSFIDAPTFVAPVGKGRELIVDTDNKSSLFRLNDSDDGTTSSSQLLDRISQLSEEPQVFTNNKDTFDSPEPLNLNTNLMTSSDNIKSDSDNFGSNIPSDMMLGKSDNVVVPLVSFID